MPEEIQAEVVKPKRGRPKKDKPSTSTVALVIDRTSIDLAEAWAKESLEVLRAFEITSQEDMDDVDAFLEETDATKKKLAAELKEITKPLRDEEKVARDCFRVAQGLVESVDATLREIKRKHELAQREKQRAALAAVAATGGEADAKTLVVAHGHENVQSSTTNSRTVWRWEVEDATKIPDGYYMRVLNKELIDELVKENGGKTEIPGIKVIEDVAIARKGSR